MTKLLLALLALALAYIATLWRASRRAEAASQNAIAREALPVETQAAEAAEVVAVREAEAVRDAGERVRPVDLFNEIGRKP